MLARVSRVFRRVSVKFNRYVSPQKRLLSETHTKRATTMYCMQCEQTSHGKGCTAQGICGKWPETANFQDLLLYVNYGLGQYLYAMNEDKLDKSLKEKTRKHLIESSFSTLTNVNFSEDRIIDYIKETINIRKEIEPEFRKLYPEKQEFECIDSSPCNYEIKSDDNSVLNEDARQLASLYANKERVPDEDCFGLRECASYGLKGMMAYFGHAEVMQEASGQNIYSQTERDTVWNDCYQIMNDLMSNSTDSNFWLSANMKVGEVNIKILELLDKAHNDLYGIPEPTEVSAVPIEGKCILMSGHDILDVKRMLELTDEEKLDINIYTHGELLPAHSYPEFKKYKNFKGHFGQAWQNQYKDFKEFPGPIIMTSNCLMPPRTRYRGRLFTAGAVGYDDVKHINTENKEDLQLVIQKAMECDGFTEKTIAKHLLAKPFLCGFGHASILSQSETIISAIKSGDLQNIFVIGGCDGTEKSRSYFTDLAKETPNNSLILTLGCGKFRLRNLELGDIGGIPRILDIGQCNDAYSAVIVALKLAEALDTDIHHLPLHFGISWFEQKAVAVLLSLLHLGIKNIRLGPALPAFLTPTVRDYLFENLGLRQIAMGDEKKDLQDMLNETSK